MKKLKLKLQDIEGAEVLSREKLKEVFGGDSGGCKVTDPNFCFTHSACSIGLDCVNNCCTDPGGGSGGSGGYNECGFGQFWCQCSSPSDPFVVGKCVTSQAECSSFCN